MKNILLSEIENIQKSLNFSTSLHKKSNNYMSVLKELESKFSVMKQAGYGPSRDTKGMVEDLVDSGVLEPGDCNYLSDDEIGMLHEEMHDGIMQAARMGHFDEAEAKADAMIETPEEDEFIGKQRCRQFVNRADGVDYVDDGLGTDQYADGIMPMGDVDKAEEGDRKAVFGRMMEFRGGQWVPIDGENSSEEMEMESEEEEMGEGSELNEMIEGEGDMIDEMLEEGYSPEEIADTLENGKPDELGNGTFETDGEFDEAIAGLQNAGYSDEEIDQMLNTMTLDELRKLI